MLQTEVLVVGAGPVGLFLAAELRRRGRQCIVVEALDEPSIHSKALALMPGTLEMFEQAGFADRFVNAANRVDSVGFVTPRRAVRVPFGELRSRYNYVLILPQWKTQSILADRLRELGGGISYGRRLVALHQNAGGAQAEIETSCGLQNIRARYVVGCDGVRSTVRELAGIRFAGTTYPGTVLLADTRVRTAVPANEARVHVHRTGAVTMFPMSDSVRRFVVIAPGETLPERAEIDDLQARIGAAHYADTEIKEILWTSAFRVHRRAASSMRSGSVLLAGDSVHAHSPVGGQGMNVGLHDAWNLASKLAAVLSGAAPETVLDRYGRERLPVAKSVLRSTDVLTRALAHPHPAVRIARERLAPRLAGLPLIYQPVLRKLSQLDRRNRLTA